MLAADGVYITASFDQQVVEYWLVERILAQFSFVLQQLAEAIPEAKIADIDAITLDERKERWSRNATRCHQRPNGASTNFYRAG